MKNLKRKGFTIVELVIVIAVIAILAAVLIPTFSSLVKKANMSSDQVAVKNMNTLLAAEFATEKPEDLREVIDMLDENGYNVDALTPLTKGYSFVWNKEENKIELVLEEEVGSKVNLNTGASYINVEAGTSEKVIEAIENGSDVTLTANVKITKSLEVEEGMNIVFDLGGHTLTTDLDVSKDPNNIDRHYYAFKNSGDLTIQNGKIESRGVMNINGNLIIKNGVVIDTIDQGGGSCVNVKGGNVIIEGGEFNVTNGDQDVDDRYYEPLAVSISGGKVHIKGGTFNANTTAQYAISVVKEGATTAELIIEEGVVVNSWRGALGVQKGTTIINGGTFNTDGNDGYALYAGGGTITVNGGVFTNTSGIDIHEAFKDDDGSITNVSLTLNIAVTEQSASESSKKYEMAN